MARVRQDLVEEVPQLVETCAGCDRVGAAGVNTVTLCSGRTVCTNCEDWRLECEVRWREVRSLLALPTLEMRRARLDAIERDKGRVFRERTEVEVRRVWTQRRVAAGIIPPPAKAAS